MNNIPTHHLQSSSLTPADAICGSNKIAAGPWKIMQLHRQLIFPSENVKSTLRPDIVMWSTSAEWVKEQSTHYWRGHISCTWGWRKRAAGCGYGQRTVYGARHPSRIRCRGWQEDAPVKPPGDVLVRGWNISEKWHQMMTLHLTQSALEEVWRVGYTTLNP